MAELTGRKRLVHLYRRAGFGATEGELAAALALHSDPDVAFTMAVDNLLNYDTVADVPDRLLPGEDRDGMIRWWLERMVHTRRPLLEKMVLFWHGHFATAFGKDGVTAARMLDQNEFFRANALGNFEQILNGISRDPAMVFWLDLSGNRKTSPNENYARELIELFALGIGSPEDPNYSEVDIKQATRAFTGYTVGPDGAFLLNASQHDATPKVVLGQSCESGDQVNAILVRHQKGGRNVCAHFLAAKLFSFFAYPMSAQDPIATRLAATFVGADFSVRALVEAILKSPEFSSRTAFRGQIKAPVELAVGALRLLGAERVPQNGVLSNLQLQGQRLFHPPDVNGWPRGRAWINASTVLSRCNLAAAIVNSLGKPAVTEAGGQLVASHLQGAATPAEKVDRVLRLLGVGKIPAPSRDALIAYANGATTDEKIRGLFNLAMALPAYQLN